MNRASLLAIAASMLVFSSASFSQTASQTTENLTLQKDISAVEQQIKSAETESAKYSGGLIKTLIDSRIQIYKNAKAMMEMKHAAGKYGISLKFDVQGKTYAPPPNKSELLQQVESEALQLVKEKEALQKDADRYGGGLIKVTKQASIATMEQQLALLEMKRCSLVYDIPFLVASTNDGNKAEDATSAKSALLAASTSKSEKSEKSEIDKMITVRLNRKWVFEANYSDNLGLDLTYQNNTEKPIKAFQGVIIFKDLFDNQIQGVRFTVEMTIPPGQTIRDSGKSIELNKYSQEDNRLRTIEAENLHLECQIKTIMFTDGSTANR
jgi:hypothetical protein